MCDLSVLLADTPELVDSVAVVSCPCRQSSRQVKAGDRAAAVVLGVRSHGKLSKLWWLLRLRSGIWRAQRTLRRLGMPETSAIAVWPSLDRSMIVYDVGTTAARYAESRVLAGAQGSLGRLLRIAAGVDMSIDVVVVLGGPAGTALWGRSVGGE